MPATDCRPCLVLLAVACACGAPPPGPPEEVLPPEESLVDLSVRQRALDFDVDAGDAYFCFKIDVFNACPAPVGRFEGVEIVAHPKADGVFEYCLAQARLLSVYTAVSSEEDAATCAVIERAATALEVSCDGQEPTDQSPGPLGRPTHRTYARAKAVVNIRIKRSQPLGLRIVEFSPRYEATPFSVIRVGLPAATDRSSFASGTFGLRTTHAARWEVPGEVTLADDGRSVAFVPRQPLQQGESYVGHFLAGRPGPRTTAGGLYCATFIEDQDAFPAHTWGLHVAPDGATPLRPSLSFEGGKVRASSPELDPLRAWQLLRAEANSEVFAPVGTCDHVCEDPSAVPGRVYVYRLSVVVEGVTYESPRVAFLAGAG